MIDTEVFEQEIAARYERLDRARSAPRQLRLRHDVIDSLAQPGGELELGFNPTYKVGNPDHFEYQWLLHWLGGFYDDSLISDVLRMVKSGKEAAVYCCRANPALGAPLAAAKIYRPRAMRQLKNDAVYREGRVVLDEEGKDIRDTRRQRALDHRTNYGEELRITSWIEHEYRTLCQLHEAGGDVPRPYAQKGNALLMEYLGDEQTPALTLNHVELEPDEAQTLFTRVMRNVELLLARDLIHADLSAYNILYWQGTIKVIDFPQAVDARFNRSAEALLARDVERVCQYFSRFGVEADAAELAADLWSRYMQAEL